MTSADGHLIYHHTGENPSKQTNMIFFILVLFSIKKLAQSAIDAKMEFVIEKQYT